MYAVIIYHSLSPFFCVFASYFWNTKCRKQNKWPENPYNVCKRDIILVLNDQLPRSLAPTIDTFCVSVISNKFRNGCRDYMWSMKLRHHFLWVHYRGFVVNTLH